MKQRPRAEAPWMRSARDLTCIPLTAFCLPSQPKQGHGIEQGTAIPALLSPSQGTALWASTPLPSASRHCTKPSYQSQQHAPAFTPAPRCSQWFLNAGSSTFIISKKQSHQSGWAGAIADTSPVSFVMERLCLSYKLFVLPVSTFYFPVQCSSRACTSKWVNNCPSHSFVEGFVLENGPQPPQISWI